MCMLNKYYNCSFVKIGLSLLNYVCNYRNEFFVVVVVLQMRRL